MQKGGPDSRISSYMGFHVLMAITPTGFLTGFGFSPASVHDTRLAETFLGLRAHPSARLSSPGQAFPTYVADRGFASEPLQLHWLHDAHAAVLTQSYNRKPVTEPSPRWRRWMHSGRTHDCATTSRTGSQKKPSSRAWPRSMNPRAARAATCRSVSNPLSNRKVAGTLRVPSLVP